MPKLVLYLATALGAGLLVQHAEAQVLYGSVVGTVFDQSDALVPGAGVTLVGADTGLTREVYTDDAGRFSFVNVLPGRYHLSVTVDGFRSLTRSDIVVTAGTVQRVDSRLELGPVTEVVTVAADVAMLQADKSDVTTEITPVAMTNLPLANYRNFQSVLNLAPGATPANFQNAVVDTPARALTTNFSGTPRNANTARVDGAQNVFVWLPHHMVYVPPVESIQTVNVATSSFEAEQGLSGGASVTVLTKSGTNDLHGSAFHLHDNQRLRTRNFFLPPDRGKPKSIFNIFGGTLGGPIVRDNLFFFGSYEGTLERAGISPSPFSVPTPDIRQGDFSAQAVTLYDPATGNPDGTGRSPFPGNVIPADRLNPSVLASRDGRRCRIFPERC
ncbi:MAG: carboxypeptidase regulatory-like domain-containing protein [Bryobacteraceae bacterium]|nr:carboxypeptidase regulatory-like domain-containing protein [Bryobacteraceae bacterium]